MSLVKFKAHPRSTNPFDALFNDFFEGEFLPNRVQARTYPAPAANVKETENHYHIELAAPGRLKSDINIEVKEDLLTIRSENKSDEEKAEKDGKEGRYTKREFNLTSFVRTFRLPEEVDAEQITASYADGILGLSIPKREVEIKKARQIEIK